MKCRETEYWLYSLRPTTSWPADVVTHLQACSVCQQLQARLKQIDQEINRLTTVPSNSTAKERLLAKIEHTPQTAIPAAPSTRRPSPWVRCAGYLTAAAALLMVGWLLGRHGPEFGAGPKETVRTVEVIREKTVEVFRDKIGG